MKNITLFILSALLALSSVSCGNPDTNETENNAVNGESENETQLETAAETIDPAELDELPADLTFDGAEFNILACYGGDSRSLIEDDFSIIPLPKYDETQKEYISHTYDSMFTTVHVNVKDTAMAGAVLESLSCEGYHKVIPAYIETTLQEKHSCVMYTATVLSEI